MVEQVIQKILQDLVKEKIRLEGMIEGVKIVYAELQAERTNGNSKDNKSSGSTEESSTAETETVPSI